MKRTYLILIFIFAFLNLIFCQSNYSGLYLNKYGKKFQINNDSTFFYEYQIDLMHTWSKGKWSIKNDTLFFVNIPIYDRYKYYDSLINKNIDTLILSNNLISEIINEKRDDHLSINQNYYSYPEKLFYKDDKLFFICKNGKICNKKSNTNKFLTAKKVRPFFQKQGIENGQYIVRFRTKNNYAYNITIQNGKYEQYNNQDTITGNIEIYSFNLLKINDSNNNSKLILIKKIKKNKIAFKTVYFHEYKLKTINKGYIIKI